MKTKLSTKTLTFPNIHNNVDLIDDPLKPGWGEYLFYYGYGQTLEGEERVKKPDEGTEVEF